MTPWTRELIREPVSKHPFKFHKWDLIDGFAGMFVVIEQCSRCNLVRVSNVLLGQSVVGPYTMLTVSDVN